LLLLGGSDDQLWPSCTFLQRAVDRLTASGHDAAHQDEGVCFPAAGHGFMMAGVPTTQSMWAPIDGQLYALGGTAEGNAHAARARADKVKAFLARVTK